MSVRDLTVLGCSSQQPTRFRNHGAYLLRWREEGLLFDPGEGTQRQFIHANIAPPVVTRIFVSHFHGDHCLGLGSMLMRLNLDQVKHEIHCYYPASGKRYFDRLRFGTSYHETIRVVEHPISQEGVVVEDDNFKIECAFLEHGIDNLGWRITEPDELKFDAEKLKKAGIRGPMVKQLIADGFIEVNGHVTRIEEVSWMRKGESVAVVIDTRPCRQAVELARGARLLLSESTYLESERELAWNHHHMTALQAAEIAKEAGAEQLVLTHYSARYLKLSEFAKEARTVFPNAFAAEDLSVFPFPKNR